MELVDPVEAKNDHLHRSDCHGYLPLLTIMSMTTVTARINRSSSPWTTSTTYWSRPIQENCLEIFATCRPPRSISYWAQNTLPLVIIVSPEGDVQNRVVHTAADYSQSQLAEAANFLNAHYAGLTIEQVRERLKSEVEQLRSEIVVLMQTAVEASSQALTEDQEDVVISGERNLLAVSDFSSDMTHLRHAFELFEQKTQLMRLLEVSSQAQGVRIYIGGESGVVPYEELSIVSAPYEVDGQVVGTLGVIGPTRMPYDRMIQIVDITSKLVSNALSGPR